MVYNLVLQYVQNEEDAQEITQDVFVAIYHSLEKFRADSKITTWIYKIAINKSLDFIKASKRKKRWTLITSIFTENNSIRFEQKHFDHPGVQLEQKEAMAKIFEHINTLPDNQKTALILNKIEHQSVQEIAVIMELTPKAVESLIQRAKNNLTKKLNPEGK